MEASSVLSWPKRRRVTDDTGTVWVATVTPGRLDLAHDGDDTPAVTITDPGQLRALSLTLYAAAIEHDLALAYPPGQGRQRHKRARAAAAGHRRREGRSL